MKFILIPGRTSDQGCGISEGKAGTKYQNAIHSLRVSPDDMAALSLSDNDRVCLRSDKGSVEVRVVTAAKGELPRGVLFIAYGDLSCRLMDSDTHGSGMPTSKGIDVELTVVS